ncbi:MAG TPA: ABC transporter permease [Dehalococcoidia bacterium]|nr:ABC transporter permease [Dehalococcoidia bacterium]
MRAIYIALNEVRLYLRDKGDLAFSLLLPIVTVALVYAAFGGETRFEGDAYVVDEDNGLYSNILIDQLEAVDGVDVELLTASEADAKLDNSDVLLVLFIPENFSEDLKSGEPTHLLFKQRGNAGDEGQIVRSIIQGVVSEINKEFTVRSQVAEIVQDRGITQDQIENNVQELLAEERARPLVGVNEEVLGGSSDFETQFLPGIVTMYVLFAVSMTARIIVEERRNGTLERLLSTRLSVGQLFLGKFLANMSRGFVQTLILLVLSYIVFQMFTPLTFLQSLVIALLFTAAVSAIGLIIASIAHSEEGASWIAVVFSVICFMFGGTFFQVAKDSAFYSISRISINTYANDAFDTILTGGGSLANVSTDLLVLVGVTVVGLMISRYLFRIVAGGK